MEQSRCLWPHPTSLELCTYHDEKLTGLMFPFQGQPLPKLACLGPRRAGARTVSIHLEPPTHSPPKSREHAGASWYPEGSIPQPYSLLCKSRLIPSTLPMEKLRPEEKELAQQWHLWVQHYCSAWTVVPITRKPPCESSEGMCSYLH